MKKITLNSLVLLLILASCGTVGTTNIKSAKSEYKQMKEYCGDVKSDKKFFRESATIKHPDLGESKYEAVQFAKAQMAENISQQIKAVTDRYKKTRTINNVVQFDKSVEGIIRYVSDVNLGEVSVICSEVVRLKDENLYQRFVGIEMSKEDVLNAIENTISKDDALYQDYKREEMRKILASEL